MEGALRLPTGFEGRLSPGAPRSLRARSRSGAPDLGRLRERRVLGPPGHASPQRRAGPYPHGQGRMVALDGVPGAVQRGLHRPGLLQPNAVCACPAGQRAAPAHGPAEEAPRRMDRYPLPGDPRRSAVRGRPKSEPRQLEVEPPPPPRRGVAATGPGLLRRVRHERRVPQDGKGKKGAPLLLVPQPDEQRRPGPATLPRTQHPRRRARRLCLRPGPSSPAEPQAAVRR